MKVSTETVRSEDQQLSKASMMTGCKEAEVGGPELRVAGMRLEKMQRSRRSRWEMDELRVDG